MMDLKFIGFFFISTLILGDSIYYSPSESAVEDHLGTGGYCKSDPTCVCVLNRNGVVLHCEGELHLSFTYGSEKGTMITIKCNSTIPSPSLNHDYYSHLKLDYFDLLTVGISDCPEPTESYASLFLPSPANWSLESEEEESEQYIFHLEISCGSRKNFSLENKHLQRLTKLKFLAIRCSSLSELRSDLFQGNTPNLSYLEISDTRLEYIPDKIFNSLANLEIVIFARSRLNRLRRENFIGLHSLSALHLSENNLSFLEEDIFESITNLFHVNFTKNSLSYLPRSLSNVINLTTLDFGYNSLEKISLNNCTAFSNLIMLHLMHNLITEIDPECFSLMGKITYIDLSGNALSKLPDNPVWLTNLKTFIFCDNSKIVPRISQFLVSHALNDLIMRNSSIVSVEGDVLRGFPHLKTVDFSKNSIKFLPEGFFSHNTELQFVYLQGNKLSELPAKVFRGIFNVEHLDISSNNMSYIDSRLFASINNLKFLDLSNNILEEIPENLLSNLTALHYLNLALNKITSLGKEFFRDNIGIEHLDLSHNKLRILPKDLFLPFKEGSRLHSLHLEGNLISSLPILEFPRLEYLNLASNKLEYLPEGALHSMPTLEHLELSKNSLRKLENTPLVNQHQKLTYLGLSLNYLENLPLDALSEAKNLTVLDLSGNRVNSFYLEWIIEATNLREIDLSNNGMSFIGVDDVINYYMLRSERSCPIKLIDLSNNNLSFNYTEWMFDENTRIWGRESPLVYCSDAEVILLVNNSIDSMFMDWRSMFPYLKLLDLRKNKIKYLTHQDLLFATGEVHDNGTFEPYPCYHSLMVDLRENQIRGVELPASSLIDLRPRANTAGWYGHVTMLLDSNPISCGCKLLNFLRLMDNDIVLTSELLRREGVKWVLPAKIEVGNLSCWEPETVRGKKILEVETWIHHLLPMVGLCAFKGY